MGTESSSRPAFTQQLILSPLFTRVPGRLILRSSRRHGPTRFTYLLPRFCARLTPRHRGGCSLWVDLGVLVSFSHSFRSPKPSGRTLPLRLLLGSPPCSAQP